MNDPQTLADLAAATHRLQDDVTAATRAVRRAPVLPSIHSRAGDLTLTAPNFPVAQFHPEGHPSHDPLSILHASMRVPKPAEVVKTPTQEEVDLALAHARRGCQLCHAWTSGLSRGAVGGAAIQRQRSRQAANSGKRGR
jgi:hypothetical protein